MLSSLGLIKEYEYKCNSIYVGIYLLLTLLLFLHRAKEQEMVLADMHLKPGIPWEYCPRETLRRVSKVLKDEFNLVSSVSFSFIFSYVSHFVLSYAKLLVVQVMNAGFENEFYLLRSVLVYVRRLLNSSSL